MQWIFAGFGFALGMWLFAVVLRWIPRHGSLLLGIAKWAIIALVFVSAIALGFAFDASAGVIVGSVVVVLFAWLVLNALPPFTAPPQPPAA